jgi:hypothetical protein
MKLQMPISNLENGAALWMRPGLAGLLLCAAALATHAQNFSLDWFSVDGGGGTSTGGVYTVSGSIGQPDAGAMSGGNYTLQGGFWGLVAAMHEPGAPLLSVAPAGASAVLLSWPYPSTGFDLEQSTVVHPADWTAATNAPVQVGDQWRVIVSPAAGNRFYRLHKP